MSYFSFYYLPLGRIGWRCNVYIQYYTNDAHFDIRCYLVYKMCPEEDFSSQFVTDFSWNKKGREDEVRAEGGGGEIQEAKTIHKSLLLTELI